MSNDERELAETDIANLLRSNNIREARQMVEGIRQSTLPAEQQNRSAVMKAFEGQLEEIKAVSALVNIKDTFKEQRKLILGYSKDADVDLLPVIPDFALPEWIKIARATGKQTDAEGFLLKQLELDAIIKTDGSLAGRTNGDVAKLNALQVVAYNFIRTMGETGRLSDQDLELGLRSLPDLLDSSTIAAAKIAQLQSIASKARLATEGKFTNSVQLTPASNVNDVSRATNNISHNKYIDP